MPTIDGHTRRGILVRLHRYEQTMKPLHAHRLLTGNLVYTLGNCRIITRLLPVPGQPGLLLTGLSNGQVHVWHIGLHAGQPARVHAM